MKIENILLHLLLSNRHTKMKTIFVKGGNFAYLDIYSGLWGSQVDQKRQNFIFIFGFLD